jgi:putative transposase
MNEIIDTVRFSPPADEAEFNPIKDRLRATVGATIEAMFEKELEAFIGRCCHRRRRSGPRNRPCLALGR